MPLQKYIEDVQKQFKTGIAREHAYRPALKNLIEELMPEITAINDPEHIKCGAPDFILHRRKLEVGYMEAKDVGIDLSKTEKTDQLKRYLESLDNLVLTDYLEFRFFLRGEKVDVIRIAELENGIIKPLPENYARLKTLLLDFSAFQGQTIRSAKKLATMMAHKARLMKHIFHNVVMDKEHDSSLKDQLKAFQNVLVHDMTEEQFADVYAQTIAYGLFTARLHDKTLEDFSRSEALLLIPKSNPFLRQLFSYIAGSELDERVVWIVDALCEVFLFSDLEKILEDFGSATGQKDPMLHFYETFLAEYDKKLRKSCGVWYTPEPVVNFIVRAIDEVLKTRFDLKDGIADKSKITIEVEDQAFDKRTKTGLAKKKMAVHKVQLLDVATGTGTFLAEAVKQIYKRYQGQEGIWSSYVENDLLPRLHGFELLMASYAMCHMKLDFLLQETGYKPSNTKTPPRLSVYLTNALEEHHPEMDTLFASWLSREANEASWIKKNMPIMVAFGNPPYAVSSTNKGEWIEGLIRDYKKGLEETSFNSLSDDYVKFIRMAENYVEKNGQGIVAIITNNSFIDGLVHSQMRKRLLETFDDIYILDLHGNSSKRETAPDGSQDKNVFDIRAGVAISIFVKTSKNSDIGNIFHYDCFGKREDKYSFLNTNSLSTVRFQKLDCREPQYYFVPRDHNKNRIYSQGFQISDLFPVHNTGTETGRDELFIAIQEEELEYEIKNTFSNYDDLHIKEKHKLKDTGSFKLLSGIKEKNYNGSLIKNISYRPFDNRKTYYDISLQRRPASKVLSHMNKDNVALLFTRQAFCEMPYSHVLVTKFLSDNRIFYSNRGRNLHAPLYLYDETLGSNNKKLNLDPKLYAKIKKAIPDITPESLFDYIYAVLHSPAYRERYAEFLKSDFPRIPYPVEPEIFHALAEKGAELRALHLMESNVLDDLITSYPIDGDHEVVKPRFEVSPLSDHLPEEEGKTGKVWINESQYFGNVPETAWNFYIGGYQPAQKWLKDRKNRTLSVEDIMHYQRIIVALTQTDRIMQEIDRIELLPKGDK